MIRQIILKLILKNTWHICNHDWVCQMASIEGGNEYLCSKCGVASKYNMGYLMILVNAETNHPFKFSPWQLNKKDCIGISISNKKN